jgi:hypothetical protein
MTSRFHSIVLVLFVAAFLVSACGNSPTQTTVPTLKNGVVPESLATMEAQSEDIIDIVPASEWSNVNADISIIEKAWATYQPQAIKDGANQTVLDNFSQALSSLKSTATSQDKIGTMQSANDLSAAVVDLFDLYNPIIPTDIGRLDVLERQIILDVANQNFSAATDTLTKTYVVWEKVKPSILAHKGQRVVEQFVNSLALQDIAIKAQNTADLTNETNNGLEIVDAMENLY